MKGMEDNVEKKEFRKGKKTNTIKRMLAYKKEENPYLIDGVQKNVKKNNGKTKKIVLGTVIAILILYAILMVYKLIKNPTDTFIVSNGSLSEEESVTGYIVRNENLVESSKKGSSIIKIKDEGQRVANGNPVYRFYSDKETELEQKISQLNDKIQEAMENNDNRLSSDKKLLETQIESELDNLYKKNETQKIQEYKKTINSYIAKKAKIVGDSSPAGSYIKNLIEERNQYESQLETESEYVTAQTSGIVSYKVDGLEKIMSPNEFGKLNKEFLENLNLKTGQNIASSDEIAKIVDNYKCYIIFNSDSEQAKKVEVNGKIKIRIQDSSEITATIKNIIDEEDGSRTIAVEIENQVEDLISYRKVSFEIIWWSASGYRIPNSAIKKIGNVDYVIRNRNGYYNKMPVKILKQNEDYSIVEKYTRTELLELGLSSTEISDLKTLTLYDEILLNPTEEQLK